MKEASTIKSKSGVFEASAIGLRGCIMYTLFSSIFLLLVVAIDSFDGKFVCSFAY